MNQFNIIITELIFVATPALGVALLDYLVFNLVQVICGGVKPFINRNRMPCDDSFEVDSKPSKSMPFRTWLLYRRSGKGFKIDYEDNFK